MKQVIWWLIDTPAWFIGSLIGSLWPIVAMAAAIGGGWLVYMFASTRIRRAIALPLSILVGLYLGMVFVDAQKWIAVQMLHPHQYDDDY